MADLDTRLADLGARWDAPPTPDLLQAVLAGQMAAPARQRPRSRRLVVALAATTIAVGAVAAVAPARNAVLRFFDIGGVRIITTPTATRPTTPTAAIQPPASSQAGPLGTPITLAEARVRAPFPLRLPGLPSADPDQVFVQAPPRDGAYALVWRDAGIVARGALVLTQFGGALVAEKTLDPARTQIQAVDVDGGGGFWLSGGPHTIGYVDPGGVFRTETTRTVADVLVWERAGVTYRIEGAAGRDQALRIAASLR